MKKTFTILLITIFIIAGIGYGLTKLLAASKYEKLPTTPIEESVSEPESTVTAQSESLPTLQPTENSNFDYQNLTFDLDGSKVKLVDGKASIESAPGSSEKTLISFFGNQTFGDLNEDGKNDVVFLITQSGTGSGTFFYVVAALQTPNGYIGTNAVFLGDRIAPQSTSIEEGRVVVNYSDRLPTEPFTTLPSVAVTKYLKIKEGKMVEVNGTSQITGHDWKWIKSITNDGISVIL